MLKDGTLIVVDEKFTKSQKRGRRRATKSAEEAAVKDRLKMPKIVGNPGVK